MWLINSSLALSALLPSPPPPRAVLLCLSRSAAFSRAWAGDMNLLRPGGAGGLGGGAEGEASSTQHRHEICTMLHVLTSSHRSR